MSASAIEALQRYGLIIGFALALWRLLRCKPLFRGGYDPVPLKGLRNPPDINRIGENDTDTDTNNNKKENN